MSALPPAGAIRDFVTQQVEGATRARRQDQRSERQGILTHAGRLIDLLAEAGAELSKFPRCPVRAGRWPRMPLQIPGGLSRDCSGSQLTACAVIRPHNLTDP